MPSPQATVPIVDQQRLTREMTLPPHPLQIFKLSWAKNNASRCTNTHSHWAFLPRREIWKWVAQNAAFWINNKLKFESFRCGKKSIILRQSTSCQLYLKISRYTVKNASFSISKNFILHNSISKSFVMKNGSFCSNSIPKSVAARLNLKIFLCSGNFADLNFQNLSLCGKKASFCQLNWIQKIQNRSLCGRKSIILDTSRKSNFRWKRIVRKSAHHSRALASQECRFFSGFDTFRVCDNKRSRFQLNSKKTKTSRFERMES